jgi:bacillithiol biosynthesis cysteine-adding enzyme BshC
MLYKEAMSGEPAVKAQCLPFSQIPHTTRLFTDFLAYSPSVQPFYPHSPHFSEWSKSEASSLRYDISRRERVSAILERQNNSWEASPQTFANLKRLRQGAAAIVTGQQVGLFGGPMFAIYKALTAVKLAEEATAAGIDSVPVFWLATSDHDLAEVNHVSLPGPDGIVRTLATSSHRVAGAPVSEVRLGEEILPVVEEAAALLGESEAAQFLRECYCPGETLGSAFARLYTRLFGQWGVILLDAADAELHRVAAPIYRSAIERSEELDVALLARGQALEQAGYYQQVKVTPSSVLLFAIHQGARTPIHRRVNGSKTSGSNSAPEFVIGSEAAAKKLSTAELLDRIVSAPENFSPNVLLRPVVQDFLLPALATTGGPAEVAYFAQSGAVYETLVGRVTQIVPRFSATLVEPKIQRLLDRHGITVLDVFSSPDMLRQKLAARNLPQELQAAFEAANKSLETNLVAIREKLALLDRTLVDAAQTAGSKMHHQLERLYTQAARADAQKGELVGRHAEMLSQTLYPGRELQERGIGGLYFVARYGSELLRSLHESIHTDCHDHQILEL